MRKCAFHRSKAELVFSLESIKDNNAAGATWPPCVRRIACGLLFAHGPKLAAMREDFILHEVPERLYPFGLAKFFGVGQKHRNFDAFDLWKNADDRWKILDDVIWQHSDPQIVDHRLQNTEIVIDRKR